MQPLRPSPSEIAVHRGAAPGRRAGGARRRDPAPSRLGYRVHRLWLRPGVRKLTGIGLPVLVIAAIAGWYLGDPAVRAEIGARLADTRRSIETRPEFMVTTMQVEGASPVLASTVRDLIAVDFPVSSFDLDLAEMQARVAGLDVVEAADIAIRPGGVLAVTLREREPVLVWRRANALELIDATGHRVATLTTRAARADLALVAGQGADQAVGEALDLLDAAGPLAGRLRGMVRVGERRWDLVLSDGPTIALPETDPVPALEQVLALDAAENLLARDIARIDMRDPRRPTLRLNRSAVAALTPATRPSSE